MASGDLQRGTDQTRLTPTIFALATGAPPTAIAIVRLTGPAAFGIAEALTGRRLPPARHLTRRAVRDPATGDPIDDALVVAFPRPASVTGDDVVEFHLHGGVAVIAAVLGVLAAAGAQPAAAGAMTRRAFDNGKLDLGQVEAIGDLIAAETDGQRRAALARTGSGLAARVDSWRASLTAIRAGVEASLDFAEEEGVDPELSADDRARLAAVVEQFAAVRADAVRGGRLRDGLTVVIIGPVNAGKSTLLNALARRDAAIVSPRPGTTRDVIETRIDLAGMAVTLIDTAGTRETDDELEIEGMRRGRTRADGADVVIALGPAAPNAVQIVGKSDLRGVPAGWSNGMLHLSAMTGDGLDLLEACLIERLTALARPAEPPLVAHHWQIAALDTAIAAVTAALTATDGVIVAEELRAATVALERLIGRVSTEALFEQVFARFCIGK